MPGLIHAESCLIIFYTNAFLLYVSRHYFEFWKIEAVFRAAISLQSPLLAASAPCQHLCCDAFAFIPV